MRARRGVSRHGGMFRRPAGGGACGLRRGRRLWQLRPLQAGCSHEQPATAVRRRRSDGDRGSGGGGANGGRPGRRRRLGGRARRLGGRRRRRPPATRPCTIGRSYQLDTAAGTAGTALARPGGAACGAAYPGADESGGGRIGPVVRWWRGVGVCRCDCQWPNCAVAAEDGRVHATRKVRKRTEVPATSSRSSGQPAVDISSEMQTVRSLDEVSRGRVPRRRNLRQPLPHRRAAQKCRQLAS